MVSVIMPVRNEAPFVEGAVRSIVAAGRAVDAFEVLVVDGISEDGTREILARIAAEHPQIRILDNPSRTVPHAMNLGISAALGDVVVRVDGHAEVAHDFLKESLAVLASHPECACVGGVIENVELTPWSKAISTAMRSRFGVGNATFRTGGREGYVDTLAFGAYRKADLLAVGGFDEELVRNQDDELNFRLLRAGRKIWLSERIRARYFVRSDLRKLFRQYFQYGYWKVYVNRKHGTITNLRQLAPPVFVASLAVLLATGPFWKLARVLLGLELAAYAAVAALVALRAHRGAGRFFRIVASLATLHTGYGLGYLVGIQDFLVLGRRPSAAHAASSR